MAGAKSTGWRPADEAEATGTLAALVEWLRATGRRPAASPPDLRAWRAADPAAWCRAVADFCAVPADDPVLLEALGEHLSMLDTRPGDRLGWSGDPDAAWPRAARLLGATIVGAP